MNRFYLGTNWKMHKTVAQAKSYIRELDTFAREYPEFTFFLIPPYTALWQMKDYVQTHQAPFLLGAQNAHFELEGAYTGEISIPMLQEIGIEIIEIGHSERRQYYNETDFTVHQKAIQVLKSGMISLICIGENAEEKRLEVSKEKIRLQLKSALYGIQEDCAHRVWIAYEPVWSIGEQGVPADSDYVKKIHACIREVLCEQWGTRGAEVPILYGGSVNLKNCVTYLNDPNVNGLFIGRSAWQPDSFRAIMQAVHQARK